MKYKNSMYSIAALKMVLAFISLSFFLVTCKQPSSSFLKSNKQKQIIAFQPFNNYDELLLTDLTFDIRDFYNKKTVILKSIDIPERYYDTTLKQYSADSLIMLLSKLRNDTIAEIIGFTHKPIFTIKKSRLIPYYDENLFGMGHQPGNACVVSDFKFSSEYRTLYFNRLRKVTIHEIGHNLGLSHCINNKCLMSEKNGNTINLDNGGNDYCQKCKNILYH